MRIPRRITHLNPLVSLAQGGADWYRIIVSHDPIEAKEALIAELVAENAALRRRLPRDEDTGLHSRPHFEERLHYEWQRALATWTGLSLLHIDATAYDDEACRQATPSAIRRIALLLEDSCRDIDVPCRLGRTIFGIILPDTNRTGAEAECKRLREILDDDSVGLGLAVAFDEAETPLELRLLAGDAADTDRRASLLPGVESEVFAIGEEFDDVLIPTPSELPLFDDENLAPFDEPPPVESGVQARVDVDEDAIPTIPAKRPSWVAA